MSANVTVGLTNIHPLIASPVPGSYTLCGQYQPGQSGAPAGPTVSVQCRAPTVSSKYVIVQFDNTDYVGLCEVEAYSTHGTLVTDD